MSSPRTRLVAFASPIVVLALGATPALGQTEDQKIHGSAVTAGDLFGQAMHAFGDTVLIAAPGADDTAPESGAVYVFERDSCGALVQQQILANSATSAGELFGSSVWLHDQTAAIGARDDDAAADAGAVYVYLRNPLGFFFEHQKLVASNAMDDDRLGESVCIEGDTIVAGADQVAANLPGKVVVWERVAGQFVESQVLVPSDIATLPGGAQFGESVGLSGNTLVVGCPRDAQGGIDSAGSLYVFVRTGPGAPFVETQKVTLPAPSTDDFFGIEVGIQGDTIVAGASQRDATHVDQGAVYVFERVGAGAFSLSQELLASDPGVDALFGLSLALRDNLLVIGAPGVVSQPVVGAGYLFERTSTGELAERGKLTGTSAQAGDLVAFSAALGQDWVVLGSPLDDDRAPVAGAAYGYAAGGLCGTPSRMPVSTGGTHVLHVDFGADVGGLLYGIFGSVSGSSPGQPLDEVLVPLNPDEYTIATIELANSFIQTSIGLLSGSGVATASLSVPAGTDPMLVGATLWHTAVVFNILGKGAAIRASNAATMTLVP